MPLMQYFLDVIAERRPSPAFVRGGLTALSYLFRAGVELRHLAYEKRWLPAVKLQAPVISVGNIVVGGTGKTPVVQKLVRELQGLCKTAILSRGFRSRVERSGKVVKVAGGGQAMYDPRICGDEPFCLGQETLADVWVGRDRVECGRRAIQEGAECLILDDGMQHRRLARDVELIVVDGKDPFSQGRFLPRGRLRDVPSRLIAADLIIANHLDDPLRGAELGQELGKYTDAPLVGVYVKPLDEEKIRGKRVGVFCGIGRPERFIETLRALDADIAGTLFVLDHCSPHEEQLHRFIEECQKKGAAHILCTVKDWVKLPPAFQAVLPIFPVGMQLEISYGKTHWDAILTHIADHITKNRISK
jgi:tetraacyldisaccharide 4'-kinase